MKGVAAIFVAVFLLFAQRGETQEGRLENIHVSFANFGAIYYPHFVAKELGYYREEGLNVEIIAMPGGIATKALVSGDLHFSTSSGSSLNASLRGIKLKVVYVNVDRPLYRIFSWRNEIRKVTDLKGKSIGIASRGDTQEISASLVLRKHGMDPIRDVVWMALGGPGRLPSLLSKNVAAAVLGFADSYVLKTRGHPVHEVVYIGREVKMLYTGLATTEELLEKRSDLVRRFLMATVKGREFVKRYKDPSLKLTKKYDRQPDDARSADYDATIEMMTQDGTEDIETQRSDIESGMRALGLNADFSTEKVFDFRLVKQIYQDLKGSNWQPTPPGSGTK